MMSVDGESKQLLHMVRIDALKLKERIVKRIGSQKTRRYFLYLLRFLSSRLSKLELDKLVVSTIGRDNVALHNQLVKGILANAVKGNLPPSLQPYQPKSKFSRKNHSPSITSSYTISHTSPSILSNGDSLLSSPHSGRSAVHHSQDRDLRASPLGPCEAHSSPEFSRSFGQLPGAATRLGTKSKASNGTDSEALGHDDSFSLKEHKKEMLPPLPLGSCIQRLQGLPVDFCSTDTGWRRPALRAYPAQFLQHSGSNVDYSSATNLPDDEILHGQIEEIAIREGLQGTNRECANMLNHALDAYLTNLIKAGVSAVCANVKEEQECYAQDVFLSAKHMDNNDHVDVKLRQDTDVLCMAMPGECISADTKDSSSLVSIFDLQVAMHMEPHQLGENWSMQLEKISAHMFYQ